MTPYGMIRWKQAGSGFEDWGLNIIIQILLNMLSHMGHTDTITYVSGFVMVDEHSGKGVSI